MLSRHIFIIYTWDLLEKLSYCLVNILAKLPKRKDWVVVISFLINPVSFLCLEIGTQLICSLSLFFGFGFFLFYSQFHCLLLEPILHLMLTMKMKFMMPVYIICGDLLLIFFFFLMVYFYFIVLFDFKMVKE
jgi:hypothetical protein